jgi:MauM/NapG family ferredoxin protein
VRFQRLVQVPLFALYLVLLWRAAYPLPSLVEVDLFLRLDPLVSLGTMASARAFVPRLAWAFVILLLAVLMGRLFCGYLCPLGTTLDLSDWVIHRMHRRIESNGFESWLRLRKLKYLFLAGIAGSSLLGISFVFLFSPLSLITRFYSFVLHPLILMFSNVTLDIFRPLLPYVGLQKWSFLYFPERSFETNLFVAALAAGIICLGLLQPRFWCRHLCPAGAIVALCSKRPLLRRRVSEGCTKCGRCFNSCPMGAIGEDYKSTAHTECITCLVCQEVCPVKAVSFGLSPPAPAYSREIDVTRRKIIGAGLAGMAVAAINLSNLRHLKGGENSHSMQSPRLIRPPGALPESEFQQRCVRCGECAKACPTNTLQPVWFEAGLTGLWSPKITPRRGGCEQGCTVCGRVCPTEALRKLDLEEKKYAKVGTARIIQSRCIAWEQDKKCLICDEICPYNAISSQFVPHHKNTVPVIDEMKCNGCGYCENKCPIPGEAAVIVEVQGELRLAAGSYKDKARKLGLVFQAKGRNSDQFILEGPHNPFLP